MTTSADADGTLIESRRLNLLRRIAESGGKIQPVAEPRAKYGYQYAAAAEDVGEALLGDELLHAAISAEAAAVALNRPAPSSRRRRDGPSFILRV